MILLYFLAANCVDGCLHLGNDIDLVYGSLKMNYFAGIFTYLRC
jgi:hypothetical protein